MAKISTINVEQVNIHIVQWLKDYAINAKVKGFVVGISGGVDSAVASLLCAQTGLKLLCVEMPIHQDPNQVSRGQRHIAALKEKFENVDHVVSDLTTVFDEFKRQVPESADKTVYHMALANTRARLRMTTLYYFAGLHGLLVAGTGNKVEDFGVGFYTKYGDGGVDISPIADLMKSDVYALARYLQVGDDITHAAPTDGLFGDDRTDEDQLGASYDELEWAMLEYEAGKTAADFSGRDHEVMIVFQNRHKANLHKMNPIPVCSIPERFLKF